MFWASEVHRAQEQCSCTDLHKLVSSKVDVLRVVTYSCYPCELEGIMPSARTVGHHVCDTEVCRAYSPSHMFVCKQHQTVKRVLQRTCTEPLCIPLAVLPDTKCCSKRTQSGTHPSQSGTYPSKNGYLHCYTDVLQVCNHTISLQCTIHLYSVRCRLCLLQTTVSNIYINTITQPNMQIHIQSSSAVTTTCLSCLLIN